nr:MAG TPA: hypothetical protein [Caudoviricetes sp.]
MRLAISIWAVRLQAQRFPCTVGFSVVLLPDEYSRIGTP